MGSTRRTAGLLTGALIAVLLAETGSPVHAAPVLPVGVRHEDVVCDAMTTLDVPKDESATAAAIMAGTVNMGVYGTMKLAHNPNWKPQPTLDLAGNRYQNSLNWALPLLREGTRGTTGPAAAETARFVYLLRDWVHDHPVSKRGFWINHPQYGGFRLGTWVCARRLLTNPADRAWVATQAHLDLAVQLKQFTLTGANNTMLNSQLAAYAAAQEMGTAKQRATALRNITELLRVLINPDGSDREGAPGYGAYYTQILTRTARVLTAYQATTAAAQVQASIAAQANFQAQATRPDRYIESIGDGALRKIASGVFPADSPATWVRTSGASGTEPVGTYSRWQGGYVFGRSAWLPGVDDTSTYYSFRTSTQALATAHRHLDTTGVTFYSQGVNWIGDPGPYRYDTSALRHFIVSRAAHSALVPPSSVAITPTAPGVLLPIHPSAAADKTCVRDLAYEKTAGLGLTRCVYYLRRIDVLVVQDVVTATEIGTTVTQQWVLPPQVSSVVSEPAGGDLLSAQTTDGQPRELRMLLDPQATATIHEAGPLLAQFGTTYGAHLPGRAITLPIVVPTHGVQTALTVLAPGDRPISITRLAPTAPSTIGALTVQAGIQTQTFVPAF